MLHDFSNTPSLKEIEESEEKSLLILLIRHYKQVLNFLEEKLDVTYRELMMICKWHNFAARKGISEPKQKV